MTRRHPALDAVRERLERSGAPGAAVAELVDGDIVLEAGIGFRDLMRTQPLAAGASFYLYSITKTVAAAITLRLAEQGRIELDRPALEYLSTLPVDRRITIRHLLSHTSGLPDYGALPEYAAAVRERPSQPWTADELLERTLAQGTLFEPGRGWQYSNIGYLIVRQVIERVTGQSFRQAVEGHIATPLGLRHTRVAETLEHAAALTPAWSAFLGSDDAPVDAAPVYHPGWVSHGVVISTARETARMLDALATGRLLRPESLDAMLTPTLLPFEHSLFRRPAYGLGVMIDAGSPHGLVFGHGGGGPGYSLAALHFTNMAGHRVTSVALANSDRGDLGLGLAFLVTEMTTG